VPPATRSVQQSMASQYSPSTLLESLIKLMPPTPTPNASKLTHATPRKTRGFRFVRPYRQRGSTCSSGIRVHGRQSRRYRGGYGQYTPSSARGERQRVNQKFRSPSPPPSPLRVLLVGVPSPPPPMAVSSSAGQTSSTTARKMIARKTIARNDWRQTPWVSSAQSTTARSTPSRRCGRSVLQAFTKRANTESECRVEG
jgi:hypothetical protein